MTLRASKPAFNVREKLTELGRRFGLKGSELAAAETVQEAREIVSAGRKNMIINGDMRIDQRSGGSATTPSSTSFTSVDRWKAVINPYSKFSMQRKTDGTVPGLPYYLRVTTTTAHSVSGSQYQLIWQPIEAINMFDQTAFGYTGAKDLSLSFWVRSSIPGPFSGVLENVGQNYAYIWEVNINQANTWEYKTVSIPGNTSGSWNTASTSAAAYLMFSMGTDISGTANAGWVNAQRLSSDTEVKRIATLGATLDLTGIQLEVGRNATEFEHRPYTEELALCQRYYEKFSADDGNGGYATFCGGGKSNNTVIVAEPVFRVPKRAVGATMTWGGSIRFGGVAGVYNITMNSIQNAQLGKHGGYVVLVISSNTNPANGNDGYRLEGSGDPNAYIAFSSEL